VLVYEVQSARDLGKGVEVGAGVGVGVGVAVCGTEVGVDVGSGVAVGRMGVDIDVRGGVDVSVGVAGDWHADVHSNSRSNIVDQNVVYLKHILPAPLFHASTRFAI